MTKIDELMRLADAYAHVYSFVRDNTMPLHREALRTALEAALKQKDEEIAELARLCDSTYVAQGADAYNHACEVLEHWQAKRAADGKEVGTTGSLCDGMAWLYERLDKLEAALKPEGPSFESATLPNGTKLYAPPPARTSTDVQQQPQLLTEEELDGVVRSNEGPCGADFGSVARAIETAVLEKNGMMNYERHRQ